MAKGLVGERNYFNAARHTARAIHFIHDAATFVCAGREFDQYNDGSIRTEYEQWIAETWDENFRDAVDTDAMCEVNSERKVRHQTRTLAERAHKDLNEQWYDVMDPGEYDAETMAVQRDRYRDAVTISNGTISGSGITPEPPPPR